MARAGRRKKNQKKAVGRENGAKPGRRSGSVAGRSGGMPAAEGSGFWQAFIGHPAGRFCVGLVGLAAVLVVILLVVGDQFDLFYKITGILILLAGSVLWLYHSLTRGRREAASLQDVNDED